MIAFPKTIEIIIAQPIHQMSGSTVNVYLVSSIG